MEENVLLHEWIALQGIKKERASHWVIGMFSKKLSDSDR